MAHCERSQASVIEQNSSYVNGQILWTRSQCATSNLKAVLHMATYVVFKFPKAEGAQTMLHTGEGLQKQLIQIDDGAIGTWLAGAKKTKTKQLSNLTGVGALGGAFWGMLFGLLFFIPFFGLAVGAARSVH
jgi:uncharacterized membrane protein